MSGSGPRLLGLAPALSVTAAAGLVLVAAADRIARSGAFDPQPLLWAGIVLIVAPIVARQLTAAPSRGERIALVLVLGLALYLVKVASNPYAFTYSDELTHAYNVDQILRTGRLFHDNPLVDITSLYPGLANVGAALTSLSGLSIFQAGIVVAAVARAMLMLGLFLLLEQAGGSARLAGIATTFYAGNPNFVFYSGEFGYESLALPLAILVIFIAARRATLPRRADRLGWTIAAVIAVLAVTITHHVTSYALVVMLVAATVVAGILRRRLGQTAPWDLAVTALVAMLAWLATVGSPTTRYLGFVFGPAAQQSLSALIAGQPVRLLFQSGQGFSSPLWQQVIAFGWVLLIAAGLGYGLFRIRHRAFATPVSGVLVLGAAAFIPVQALRLTQAGWETANRSSEFLFIGCALVLAVVAADLVSVRGLSTWTARAALTACGSLLIGGGIVAGWPYVLQLPPPYIVEAAGNRTVEPEGITDARWTEQTLGRDNVVALDPSNGLMFATYGGQRTYMGPPYGVQAMLLAPNVDASVQSVLQALGVRYVVVDRRLRSLDHTIGFYPPGGSGPLNAPSDLLDRSVYEKFDASSQVNRLADSGNVVIYDVGVLANAPTR